MQERALNEYSLRLEPVAEAPAADVWSELRLICRSHGGWAFIRSGGGVIAVEDNPPFFRFEDDESCPDPEMAAQMFREDAGKRLAEMGFDHEIEIVEVVRPRRFDVTVTLSVAMCSACDNDPVFAAKLCQDCHEAEVEFLVRRRIDEDGGDCGYTHDQLRRMIAADMNDGR